MDDDYDDDRYNSDSDYADGADDALADYDEGEWSNSARCTFIIFIEYCTHICYTLYYL